MRNILIALALFFALCTAALAAKPIYESQSLLKFAQEYKQAYNAYELDKFERTKVGLNVEWQGVVTDVNNTGTSFYIMPNYAVDVDGRKFQVFVQAELKSGESVATVIKVGEQAKVRGRLTSVSVLGAIVVAKEVCPQIKPKPEAE